MKKVTEEKDIYDKLGNVIAIIGIIIFIASVIYAIIESNAEPEYDFSHLRRSSYSYSNSSSSFSSTYSDGNSSSQQASSYYTPSKSYKSSSSKNTKSDPYNAKDYSNEEDFYDDHYDDFFDYYDAEDYYNEHN